MASDHSEDPNAMALAHRRQRNPDEVRSSPMDPPGSTLRIVSWNCNMALAKKATRLLALTPDVAIVQECASSAQLDGLDQIGWVGRQPKKGLGVFARASIGAVVAEDVWDPTREWFLPIRMAPVGLDLLAGWAMNHRGQEDRPKVGRVQATIEHYRPFLSRAARSWSETSTTT